MKKKCSPKVTGDKNFWQNSKNKKKNWYPFRFISLFGVNYLERLVIRKAARRISTKAHLMWLATSISFLHFWLTDRRDSPRSVGIQQIILKSCSFWHIADKGVFQIERSCSDWGNWNWLGIGFGKRVNFLIIWRMCSIFGVIFAFSPLLNDLDACCYKHHQDLNLFQGKT